jgi:hypothetical protein
MTRKTGLIRWILGLFSKPKKLTLTLDCMTCKSWPQVCQKCYERRK